MALLQSSWGFLSECHKTGLCKAYGWYLNGLEPNSGEFTLINDDGDKLTFWASTKATVRLYDANTKKQHFGTWSEKHFEVILDNAHKYLSPKYHEQSEVSQETIEQLEYIVGNIEDVLNEFPNEDLKAALALIKKIIPIC